MGALTVRTERKFPTPRCSDAVHRATDPHSGGLRRENSGEGVGCRNGRSSLKATFMDNSSWFVNLEQTHTSYLLLATLAVTGLAAGILYQIGLIGWVLRGLGMVVRGGIRSGFLLWERLLAWASWPLFLAIVLGFLACRWVAGGPLPALRVVVRPGPAVHGGHRLPGLHVHRPGTV